MTSPKALACWLFLSLCFNYFTISYFTISYDSRPRVDSPKLITQKEDRFVLYGHVHIFKTAGTEINGALANSFEHVCGHKGYSYDFYNYNKREHALLSEDGKHSDEPMKDSYTLLEEHHHRGRVPFTVMNEIGYEDCDYLSHEIFYMWWKRGDLTFQNRNLDLHVPCRDPLEHLMSQCNHMGRIFDCNSQNLERDMKKCIRETIRFDMELESYDRVQLFCFNPIPIDPYIKFMSTRLEPKKYKPQPYIHRDTNKPRKRSEECIWKSKALQEKVKNIMIEKYDYYRFCDQCMGSEKDLLA